MSQNEITGEIVKCYGDLLFDLCESVLWSPANAQQVFRAILKDIRHKLPYNGYSTYERPWLLKIACEHLKEAAEHYARKLTAPEQIELDAHTSAEGRLKNFGAYFHRISVLDQIILLLKDKYGLPFSEIAAATGLPEGTLKIRRQQSLRTLEEWIWVPT